MTEPTATSYVLLALLNLRPWTAYELAQQMTRGLRFIWSRAERAVYDEPKRLVGRGWAKSTTEMQGRRRRTVYAITPAGRRALGKWLAQESAPPQLESEALMRLTFAECGSPESMRRATADLSAHAQEIFAVVEHVSSGYLSGEGTFPQRAHLVSLGGRFLLDYATLLARYAEWVGDQTIGWDRTDDPSVLPHAAVFEELRAAARRELDAARSTRTDQPARRPRSR